MFFKNWFHSENIIYYFPLIASALFIGDGLGAIIPFVYLDENQKNVEVLKVQYNKLCNFCMILAIANFFISLIFFRNKTKGFKEEKMSSFTLKDFFIELKNLLTQSAFLKFVVLIAIGRGTLTMIVCNLNIFFKKLDFNELQGSIALEGFLLLGLLGSSFYNNFFHHRNQTKLYLILFTFLG